MHPGRPFLLEGNEAHTDLIADRAAAVDLAHTDPSGDVLPGDADLHMLEQMVEAGRTLGLQVLDHIIVARKGHFSFREAGLMK